MSSGDPGLFARQVTLAKTAELIFELPPFFQIISVNTDRGCAMEPSYDLSSNLGVNEYVVLNSNELHTHIKHVSVVVRYLPLIEEIATEDITTSVTTVESVTTIEEGVEVVTDTEVVTETTALMTGQTLLVLPNESEFIGLKVAIRCMKKAESPTTDLERDLSDIYKRLVNSTMKATHSQSMRVNTSRRHR